MARLVDPVHPREFNYALLDLGALVCRATRTRPEQCPIALDCAMGRQTLSTPQIQRPAKP